MSTTRLHNIETNILSTDSIYSLLGCMLGETVRHVRKPHTAKPHVRKPHTLG